MDPDERVVVVEHYGRMLYAYERSRRVFAEAAERGDHWFHTKVRRSNYHLTSKKLADDAAAEIPRIIEEAGEHGISEAELQRWCFVLMYESGEIKVPPTLLEVATERS